MGHDIKLAESFVMRGKLMIFTDILSVEVENPRGSALTHIYRVQFVDDAGETVLGIP